MYLKSIEMHGFKSFPDKTKLTFDANGTEIASSGVTVIVGPNGSGKSNISDAMRWVLGEISSKSLRGTKMEDVIFGGADSRKPMGFAEVSVTFDNTAGSGKLDCPYDEVTVTRRYYRAGESEYFINRKAVRLRDIYELFMNTGVGREGYSIIGQGRIAEMVSKKSDERRSIFEDASGISKYRYKKNEAERKLSQTEDNMTRVNDIFVEVEAQVGPLEKEAERAKRAIELLETKKRADVSLWLYETERLRLSIASAEEALSHSTFDLQNAEDSLRSLEQQNDRLFEASQSNKLASEQLLTLIREQTDANHKLDSEYRVKESNIAHTKELIASSSGSLASSERSSENEVSASAAHAAKIAEIESEIETLTKERENVAKAKKEVEEQIRALEFDIATSLEDIRSLEKEATDIRVRRSVLENAKNSDSDKNVSIVDELEGYRQISSDLTSQCKVKERAAAAYAEEIANLDTEIAGLRESLEELYEERRRDTEALNSMRFKRDSITQRVATFKAMEEHLEGYIGSVRYVMNKYKSGEITGRDGSPCGKIYGPLSKVVEVEDKYITAIETALGANLQNIVVEDEDTAKAAMFCLKRGEAGRATFFPLTSMKAQTPTPQMNDATGFAGYIASADSLVSCDAKFRNVISSLLGRTLIFDTIENATKMAKAIGYRVKTVTLDGQQINVGGSFTGGSAKQNNGILSRSGDIKKLEAEAADLSMRIKSAEGALSELEEKILDAEDSRDSRADKKELIGVLMNTENAQLEQLRAKLDANNTLSEKLKADFEQISRMRLRYEEDIASLTAEEENLSKRIEEISLVRQKKDIEKGALDDDKQAKEDDLTSLYIKIVERQKDAETERTLLASCEDRIREIALACEELNAKIAELHSNLEVLESEMQVNRVEYESGEKVLAELNAKRAEVEAGSFEFEQKLNAMSRKMREKQDEKSRIFVEHTKNKDKLERLNEENDKVSTKLWDDYELTRSDALALGYPPVDQSNRAEMMRTQTECRNKLRAMGNVDLDAVSKYKEVKERYDYMSAQISDLERAKAELVDIISKLEVEMKTAFVTSFNQINENFNRTFSELFGGGSAELSLSDPENVLESGIEIKAAPPGKIIKSLMQLSGGEQAFIGVALFFAILQVNPTPFCILDEIEAALDEVNVERLAAYIKRYSQGTQFIMITHRRGTMAAANRLYGVTMPEHGISKILTLNVDDIAKGKEGDWDGIFG